MASERGKGTDNVMPTSEDEDELLTHGQKRFVGIVAIVVVLLFLPLLYLTYVQPRLTGHPPAPYPQRTP